jgi:hypothetical protein
MSYPHLIPGVRALLSISSGNAGLERFFGSLKSHLTPQKLRSHGRPMYLKHNCSALGMRAYMAEEDLQQEHQDSGSEAASNGDCEQVLSQSDCGEDVEEEHEGGISDEESSCAICSSSLHITTSCPFCFAGFWADADESQKMRQAIFHSSGREFGSKEVEVRVVASDGDCLFAALGLELQACGVLVFDGVVDDLGHKVRALFLALLGDLDRGGAHLVFGCPLRLWLETSSGLEYSEYLQDMQTGSAVRSASWGGLAEAHLLCIHYGCKLELYEQHCTADSQVFKLAVSGGNATAVTVCRLVWTGTHFNALALNSVDAD